MFDKNPLKQSGKPGESEAEAGDRRPTMGSDSRPGPSRAQGGEPATIGPSIRIRGELSGDEDLVIEGSVEGNIHLEGNNLTIGRDGRVNANIQAQTVSVLGELRGDIVANAKVVIRNTGNVRGNIVSPRVSLEDGAMFKGSIEMEPDKAAGGAKAAPAKPAVVPTGGKTDKTPEPKAAEAQGSGS